MSITPRYATLATAPFGNYDIGSVSRVAARESPNRKGRSISPARGGWGGLAYLRLAAVACRPAALHRSGEGSFSHSSMSKNPLPDKPSQCCPASARRIAGKDRGTAKLQHQPAIEIEPQRRAGQFTRRVRHIHPVQSTITSESYIGIASNAFKIAASTEKCRSRNAGSRAAMPHGPRSDAEPAGSSGRSLRVDSGKEPVYLPRGTASWQHCERVRRKRETRTMESHSRPRRNGLSRASSTVTASD